MTYRNNVAYNIFCLPLQTETNDIVTAAKDKIATS